MHGTGTLKGVRLPDKRFACFFPSKFSVVFYLLVKHRHGWCRDFNSRQNADFFLRRVGWVEFLTRKITPSLLAKPVDKRVSA